MPSAACSGLSAAAHSPFSPAAGLSRSQLLPQYDLPYIELDLQSEITLLRRFAGQLRLPGWYMEPTPSGFCAGPCALAESLISATVLEAPASQIDVRTSVVAPLGAGWLYLQFTHPADLSPAEAHELQRFVAALVDHLAQKAQRLCQGRVRRVLGQPLLGPRR